MSNATLDPARVHDADAPVSLFGPDAARAALHREGEAYVARACTMMRRARALVVGDRVANVDLLAQQRERLAVDLARYQRFKHQRIFDPVVAHGSASSKIVARTMKFDCFQLGETFTAYHARWRHLRASEWSVYRRDMIDTVDLLHTSLAAEARAIRQLLLISHFYAASHD